MGSGETQDLAITEIVFGKDRFHQNPEIAEWLIHHFGRGMWYKYAVIDDPDCRWAWESAFGTTRYYFRDDKDALLFVMRWS